MNNGTFCSLLDIPRRMRAFSLKKDVAAVRTNALALIEARVVGSKEYVRRHDVVDFSEAALGN
jgi:hypothetical protein